MCSMPYRKINKRKNYHTILKKMKKTVLAAVAALLATGMLHAQTDTTTISQRIEVTRQYVPEVGGARKLDFQPRMADTVTLKPDISYSITPTPWRSVFGTDPIAPVSISTAEYERHRPLYMLLGGGYPAQSFLDLYADLSTLRDTRFGIYARHYGQWSDPGLQTGGTNDGWWTDNRIGLYASRDFGERTLDFDLRMDMNLYALTANSLAVKSSTNTYLTPKLSAAFGDNFTDLSHFNYRIGVSGSIWFPQRSGNGGDAAVDADFGWRVGKGFLQTSLAFDGWWADGEDWYASFAPNYRMRLGKLAFRAGLKIYYNSFRLPYTDIQVRDIHGSHIYLLPDIGLEYNITDALAPYVTIDGNIGDGSWASLMKLNPYLYNGATARPKSLDARIGIRGAANEVVTYDIYAGYSMSEMPFFIGLGNTYDYMAFGAGLTPADIFHAGAGVGVRIPAGFSLYAGIRYNHVSTNGNLWSGRATTYDSYLIPFGAVGTAIPECAVTGKIGYEYRGRLFVNVGIEVAGRKYYAAVDNYLSGVPATVNLSAGIEYRTGERFALFVAGDNLLDQQIYRHLGYNALGANVTAGIKALF